MEMLVNVGCWLIKGAKLSMIPVAEISRRSPMTEGWTTSSPTRDSMRPFGDAMGRCLGQAGPEVKP